nr:MAG TPA: hypothetical protein [Caudoviricetes sp.]
MLKISELSKSINTKLPPRKQSELSIEVQSKVAFAESKLLYESFDLVNIIRYQTAGEAVDLSSIDLDGQEDRRVGARIINFFKRIWNSIKKMFKALIYKLTGVSQDVTTMENGIRKRAKKLVSRKNTYKMYKNINDQQYVKVPVYMINILNSTYTGANTPLTSVFFDLKIKKKSIKKTIEKIMSMEDYRIRTYEDAHRLVLPFISEFNTDGFLGFYKKFLNDVGTLEKTLSRQDKSLNVYKLEDIAYVVENKLSGTQGFYGLFMGDNKIDDEYSRDSDHWKEVLDFSSLEEPLKKVLNKMESIIGKLIEKFRSKEFDLDNAEEIDLLTKTFKDFQAAMNNFQKLNTTLKKITSMLKNVFYIYDEILDVYEKYCVQDRDEYEKNKKKL